MTKYPRFAAAPSLNVTLSAGSALYIPAGWWHAVVSLETSISLALRSHSSCQRTAALLDDSLRWLHQHGLYKYRNCVCHKDVVLEDAAEADGGGLDRTVENLLQSAGINVAEAKAAIE